MSGSDFARSMTALAMLATGVSQAAHVYAVSSDPNDSGLKVYEVQTNGSLVFKTKTTGPGNTQIVATPGGRYVYQYDGRWLHQFDVLPDGTLQQSRPPVSYPSNEPYTGIFTAVMHTTGDYVFASTGSAIQVFRTDDVDGHLTWLSSVACLDCGNALEMDGQGEFLFAAGGSDQPNPGPTRMITTYRIDPTNGTLTNTGKHWYGRLIQQIRADTRYLYAWTSPTDTDSLFHALEIAVDGSLHETASAPGAPLWCLVPVGRYFAASPTGSNSDVRTYTIGRNGVQLISVKPTEVMYTIVKGSGRWANTLFVVTDDGIVTYQVTIGGTLTRIGKVMIPFANPVFFVNK